MLDWSKPIYAYLLLVIPFLIYGIIGLKKWSDKRKFIFSPSQKRRKEIFKGVGQKYYWFSWSSFLIAIVLVIFSLMDPVRNYGTMKIDAKGIDVVFVLDISASMDTQDVPPSRLNKAKNIINQVVNQFAGNRVGLVYFSGDAFLGVPLTSDYNTISSTLEVLSTDVISNQGTNIPSAIEEAVIALKDSPLKSKAIIILSDGENHMPSVETAVNLANQNKIKIYTVGVGSTKGGPVPVITDGYLIGYKTENGKTVISRLDARILENIADKTQGKYISGNQDQYAIDKVTESLNTLEKDQQKQITSVVKNHYYQWFLLPAILLLFIYILTGKKTRF